MLWKFLRPGARSPFTGHQWVEGQLLDEAAEPQACRRGIHACRLEDLPYWMSEELWEIELHEPVVVAGHKVLAGSARLGSRVDAWNAATSEEFARACIARCVGHAVAELRAARLHAEADMIAASQLERVADSSRAVMAALGADPATRRAARLQGYVVDAAESLGVYPPAAIAYIAARAAHHRSGPADADPYTDERRWQAAWLAERLQLGTGG